jgi:hypothetical protein
MSRGSSALVTLLPELTLSTASGAYEYGTSQPTPGIVPQPLPEG